GFGPLAEAPAHSGERTRLPNCGTGAMSNGNTRRRGQTNFGSFRTARACAEIGRELGADHSPLPAASNSVEYRDLGFASKSDTAVGRPPFQSAATAGRQRSALST